MRDHRSTRTTPNRPMATRPRRGAMPAGERRETGGEDLTTLEVVDHGGLHITEHELRYQLRRRGVDDVGVLERMMDLEKQGLIESTLCFRLTQAGVQKLPDGHERPSFVGYRSSWTVK